MVFGFCSKCEVLVMRRRERLLANVSLMLLASCCLVICTDQSRDGGDVDGTETISINRFSTNSVLDESAAGKLLREASVLGIASELCARFPDQCRQASDDDNDEEISQKFKASAASLTGRRTQPWPSRRLYELFNVEEARRLISGTNRTVGQRLVDEFGLWREPMQSEPLLLESPRRTNSNDATRSNQQDEARFGVKIEQQGLGELQQIARARHLGRIRQRWQQRNMDQHIVEALPSAFAFTTRPPVERGEKGARLRSTRQQRSDDDQQPPLPLKWVGLEGAASETTTKGQHSSTTSGHQIIQSAGSRDDGAALQCSLKQFRFTATKTDEQGNLCSGEVKANICYGGCDTGEIADWLFPGKKSIHKVCRHGKRIRKRTLLNDCNNDSISLDNPLRLYHYVDAQDCVCKKCNSADTTCLGTMSRPYLQTLQGASTNEPGGDD